MILSPLTTQEKYRLAERFNLQPPAPKRVLVVNPEPERPMPAMTVPEFDQHSYEVGGVMGIGPSLEEQRRARQKAYREAVAFLIIGLFATFGALLVIWSLAAIVRTAIG